MKQSDREYFMDIAFVVRKDRCLRRKVGAVLVLNKRIISTGYNGVPVGMENCSSGGCQRCSNPKLFPKNLGYDVCLCVHAEMNALLIASKHGVSVDGAWMFSTLKPCLTCLKSTRQSGIVGVVYSLTGESPSQQTPNVGDQAYSKLSLSFKFGVTGLA